MRPASASTLAPLSHSMVIWSRVRDLALPRNDGVLPLLDVDRSRESRRDEELGRPLGRLLSDEIRSPFTTSFGLPPCEGFSLISRVTSGRQQLYDVLCSRRVSMPYSLQLPVEPRSSRSSLSALSSMAVARDDNVDPTNLGSASSWENERSSRGNREERGISVS